MKIAVIYSKGTNWIAGRPVTAQNLAGHAQLMRDLHDQGTLVMAGPFLDEEGGGMAILRCGNLAEASKIIEDDQAVKDGVMRASLRPWYIAFPESSRGGIVGK